jgi:uncharacterized protein (DUF736 family)
MRKSIIDLATLDTGPRSEQEWLDLEPVARLEVTSEEPNFPIESALSSGTGPGWRASQKGQQIIRIIFDQPRPLRRIRLEFSEVEIERTQEFTLRWSPGSDGTFRDIVRQQWSFSPHGSTSEVEDYQVSLDRVSVLELALRPDLTAGKGNATLAKWRVA